MSESVTDEEINEAVADMTKQESARETAERIVNQIAVGAWQYCSRQWVVDAIEAALLARDERAVTIIREHQASDKDKCEGSCWAIITDAILSKE